MLFRSTLEEIGGKYEISKERVRQIEARALEKIRLFTADKYVIDNAEY